jgi:conjugal transfer ATP-binding protein TraC
MVESQINQELTRDRLSDYLPYLAYDNSTGEFLNTDSTFGLIYECSPLYFAGDKTNNMLTSIIKQDYGKNSVLQFILYADTNIDNHCQAVRDGDVIQTKLSKKMGNYHTNFLQTFDSYKNKTKGNRLKNYRLFVCLKTTESLDEVMVSAFEESLTGLGFAPRKMNANLLLSLTRQLLNGAKNNQLNYDDNKSISKQAIFSDTNIDFDNDKFLKIGDNFVGVVTPKEFPDEKDKKGLTNLQINKLLGSYQGGIDDLEQINSRFMISCNIVLDKVDNELRTKSTFANGQIAGAKLSNNIADRIKALANAVKNIDNDKPLKFIPSIVLFAENKKELAESQSRVKRLWSNQGFIMQDETYIKHIMFLSSLPFGLYLGKKNKNINTLDRHFIASSEAIANQLPVQADCYGFGHPIVPFIGRKSQVQGLDIFSKGANNHNFLCCATSGSGKSFFINWLVSNYLSHGVKIRLIDIGGSYKKISNLLGGEFIDIAESKPNFNPFQLNQNLKKTYVQKSDTEYDEEDKEHDIDSIVMTLGAMIYANTERTELTPEEHGLLTHAVKEAVARDVVENGIDFIQDYLSNLYEYSSKEQIPESLSNRAKELSFNLCEFSSKGQYGEYFNKVTENTWQDNDFVVLELEALTKKPTLMKVVMLQIINMMTMEMYQGDRSIKKMLILEEMKFLLNASSFMEKVIEDGFRRARKYNGSFSGIFQSILDAEVFGVVGRVMLGNSAFKFFLESDDLEEAITKGLVSYSGIAKELLLSLKSNRPHYSELFVDTPGGVGVYRLMVGPYGYAIATSDADEITEIENYQQEGLSTADALEKFAAKRGLKV